MTDHSISAVNTITDLDPIAGIENNSIATVCIVNIDVAIIDRFFLLTGYNVVVSNNTTNINSAQRHHKTMMSWTSQSGLYSSGQPG